MPEYLVEKYSLKTAGCPDDHPGKYGTKYEEEEKYRNLPDRDDLFMLAGVFTISIIGVGNIGVSFVIIDRIILFFYS